ncbi:hypothetical protein PCC9214_01084 [Planktothrix tepida]|nr:hypothetical protein PCC9214_01084 [Planktothrix tepida]
MSMKVLGKFILNFQAGRDTIPRAHQPTSVLEGRT